MTIEQKEKGVEKDEAVELTVFSKDGRFYQKSEEGEWVDVTDKWEGEDKEN